MSDNQEKIKILKLKLKTIKLTVLVNKVKHLKEVIKPITKD